MQWISLGDLQRLSLYCFTFPLGHISGTDYGICSSTNSGAVYITIGNYILRLYRFYPY